LETGPKFRHDRPQRVTRSVRRSSTAEESVGEKAFYVTAGMHNANQIDPVPGGKVKEEDLLESVGDREAAHLLEFRVHGKRSEACLRLPGEHGEGGFRRGEESVSRFYAGSLGVLNPLRDKIPFRRLALENAGHQVGLPFFLASTRLRASARISSQSWRVIPDGLPL